MVKRACWRYLKFRTSQDYNTSIQNACPLGFPGGSVVKNLPANAGEHGFEPWPGKIPHAAEQLTPWATAPEPACHNYWSARAWSPCSATREATAVRRPRTATKSSPCSPQLERARAQQRRPNAAKNKIKEKKACPQPLCPPEPEFSPFPTSVT